MELKATIAAKKLKHAITVLKRLDSAAIFEIADTGVICRLGDVANTQITEIKMPDDVFDFYTLDEPHEAGIDLKKLTTILMRATAKDGIDIISDSDESWRFTRGIHTHTLPLRPVEGIRHKAPKVPDLSHTATLSLSGREFKEIIAETNEVGEALRITARSSEGMIFDAEALKDDVGYRGKLGAERLKIRAGVMDVQAYYSIDYLQDIATDMQVDDEVIWKFATNVPCEILYARDGVTVRHILAARIESEEMQQLGTQEVAL